MMLARIALTLVAATGAEVVQNTLVVKYGMVNADGTWLRVPLVNGSLPGPTLRAQVGDTLETLVVNDMKKEVLSMGWVAMSQKNTNHMDGVPGVTEFPIQPAGGSRLYRFVVDKPGTFSYHAYVEIMKQTVFGLIIVTDPGEPLSYDADLVGIRPDGSAYPALVATDYYHLPTADLAAQLDNNIGDWIWAPQSILVNGQGLHDCGVAADSPYYFRCTWQCPAADLECIDEVRCSRSPRGPYISEERGSHAAYDALVATGLYDAGVQAAWSSKCLADHLLPWSGAVVDGVRVGEHGVAQSQFLNWGRPSGLACNASGGRDPRCLPDGTWPFKGMNKGRVYDHLRLANGTYDIHHFDQADLEAFGATCRPTRFYTGDYQPESNHNPFGLFSHSKQACDGSAQEEAKARAPTVYEVEAGKTYRLRAASLATLAYLSLVIEGHSMRLVQVDGRYVEPVDLDFLDLWIGQTYSVLVTASAEPGDYWIGLSPRHRGYTRIDPGRAILRYVTKNATGFATPAAPPEQRLPADASRPVPKWWDARRGGYNATVPRACPRAQHASVFDAGRDMLSCPGFYPAFNDQDISMRQQYQIRARSGMYALPALTDPGEPMAMLVQGMNVVDFEDIDTYKACASDYGGGGVAGTYVTAYSYRPSWDPKTSVFRPNTDLAGSMPRCGTHRWSVNNITYPKRRLNADTLKPLLQLAYEGQLSSVPGLVDVKRADETPYFQSFPAGWYETIDPSRLGRNHKESQGVSPASLETTNVMQFPLGKVFDVVMQNTVYLEFWVNALYGNKHSHRSGSNQHPYHAHGFDFWTLGYGEGNFNESAWNSVGDVSGAAGLDYGAGQIHFKNTQDPPLRNLAVNFAGGWTVLRVRADNPGAWLVHCTVMSHWHMGMGVVMAFGLDQLPQPSPFDDARSCPRQPGASNCSGEAGGGDVSYSACPLPLRILALAVAALSLP